MKFPHDNSGFTLIEMTIVVAIIAILTSMTLIYSRSGSGQLELFKDRAMVIGILNQAKALAIEKSNKNPDACAFGIHFDSGSGDFLLFQDLKPSTEPFCKDFSGSYKNDFQYNDSSELVQTFSIGEQHVINITSGGTPVSGSVDVAFIPPELMVTSTSPLPLSFNIADSSGVTGTRIILNSTGQITSE